MEIMDEKSIVHLLGKLEGKIDCVLMTQAEQKIQLNDIDNRVKSLEQHRSWFLGLAAAAGALTAFLLEVIAKVVLRV